MNVPPIVTLEACTVDMRTGTVQRTDGATSLSLAQLELLRYLAARPGQTVSRDELLRAVWGYTGRGLRTRATDFAVLRIRQRIERDPASPRHLLTHVGFGYRFEPLSVRPRVDVGTSPVLLGADGGLSSAPNGVPVRLDDARLLEVAAAAERVVVVPEADGQLSESVRAVLLALRPSFYGTGRPEVVIAGPNPIVDAALWPAPIVAIGTTPTPVAAAPGAAFSPAAYVARPAEEEEGAQRLEQAGAPLVLTGPRSVGKSWLLHRILERLGPDDVLVEVDVSALTPGTLREPAQLSLHLALALAEAVDAPAEAIEALWATPADPYRQLNRALGSVVLPLVRGRLVFVLDHADHLRHTGEGGTFFGLLRSMASRTRPPWDQLRLSLVVSTEPALLVDAPHLSPFNLVTPIVVEGFDADQLRRLAAQYRVVVDDAALRHLRAWTGGHPMLARTALHAAQRSDRPLGVVLDDEGPFVDHLRSRFFALRANPTLGDAMRIALRDEPVDPLAGERLVAAGLCRREGGRYRVANDLYARWLGAWLGG